MAGGVGVPTPWWQIPGPVGRDPRAAAANLEASAPPGYTYDKVAMRYVPIIGSATDALAQRTREQNLQDELLKSFGLGSTGSSIGTGSSTYPSVGYEGSSSSPSPTVNWPGTGTVPGGGGVTLPTERIAVPDTSAAQAAIFNRAKDQVGRTTSGSMTALRSALASRGLLGGGAEVKGTANILTGGQQQLGDTTREQAIQEATRQNDFAKLGYQGAIVQRGQDITTTEGAANRALDAAKAAYSGGITQRGQDIEQGNVRFQGGVTTRGQDVAAATAARSQALGALTSLLPKLY